MAPTPPQILPRVSNPVKFIPGQRAPQLIPVDFARQLHLPWMGVTFILSAVILSMTTWEYIYERTDYLQSVSMDFLNTGLIEEFDFIVVGGGSAGSVVANRLSKNPLNKVLLLEAGGVPNPIMRWPAMAYVGQLKVSAVDWMYETLPQVNSSQGLNGKKVRIPRGKGLGGSSNLNLMYYQRGNARDFNRWAEVTGDPEWNFQNVLPAFKSTENYHGHNPSEKFHHVSSNEEGLYVGQVEPHGIPEFLSAAKEKGYHVEDPNADQRESFSRMDVTIKDGKRFSTYEGFLRPIKDRDNLKIYLYSRAIKIHLDRSRTAYGVTYKRHGITKFVRARKEIIISSGAIDTPRLLLLSGIGPKSDLHSVGLKCRVNLPVGHNFQDHPLTIVGPFTVDDGNAVSYTRESNILTLRDYFTNGQGFIATPDASSGVGYVGSSLAEKDWPDIQYTLVGAQITVPLLALAHNIRQDLWNSYVSPYSKIDNFGFGMVLGLPRSRGQVRLRSKNPEDKPIIDAQYFTHPDDMKIMVDGESNKQFNITFCQHYVGLFMDGPYLVLYYQGMRKLVELVEDTQAYRKINARFATTAYPGCEGLDLRSDEYYECFLRFNTFTVHHPSCTVPMGKSVNDYPAALDSKLRVFKTSRLRVIDASVMPYITNANLNAPVIMIGEKGSFFIRDYWATQYLVCRSNQIFLKRENDMCFYSRLP